MQPATHLLKISRLEGLTDGIFAIAMTILVLDLHLPSGVLNENLFEFLHQQIFLKLLIYMGSFIILGTLWVAMNFQLGLLDRLSRVYLWANVFYLMVICVVPFSANLLGLYPNNPISIYLYACNLLFASVGQMLTAFVADKTHLNKDFYNYAIKLAVIKRIFVAPIFYVASILVAPWNTYIAFGLLLAPTLIYILPGQVDTYEEIKP